MAQQARIHHPHPLAAHQHLALEPGAARHVQVLRMQPGEAVTLFDGLGGQFEATILEMGRREVSVEVGERLDVSCEAALAIHLIVGLMANDRMDWLVEKATELGVSRITPLLTERSVLRLSGERADKKRGHWQGVAIAACEQCGRNRVPQIDAVATWSDWAKTTDFAPLRVLLSLDAEASAFDAPALAKSGQIAMLSGPEGGLSAPEQSQAKALGFTPTSLGARVLRAETAPIAALSALVLNC